MAGLLFPLPCCGSYLSTRYSCLQHTSSHIFPLFPKAGKNQGEFPPFVFGNKNLRSEDTKPEILICCKVHQDNGIYNHNVWEGTPLKCFLFLLRNTHILSVFALLDLWIFICQILLSRLRLEERNLCPSIPCSILVRNTYAYHLFLLFQSKLV